MALFVIGALTVKIQWWAALLLAAVRLVGTLRSGSACAPEATPGAGSPHGVR